MSDNEEDIFASSANVQEASSLVSKWLADSEDENSSESEAPATHTGGRNTLSRLDGYVRIQFHYQIGGFSLFNRD